MKHPPTDEMNPLDAALMKQDHRQAGAEPAAFTLPSTKGCDGPLIWQKCLIRSFAALWGYAE